MAKAVERTGELVRDLCRWTEERARRLAQVQLFGGHYPWGPAAARFCCSPARFRSLLDRQVVSHIRHKPPGRREDVNRVFSFWQRSVHDPVPVSNPDLRLAGSNAGVERQPTGICRKRDEV